MGIQFEFFEAGCGDSILVSTEEGTNEGTNILIDGGVATTYQDEITYSLDKLNSDLDLVVVTHIDTDHICGIIELLNDKYRRNMIKKFWFNTASEKMRIMEYDNNEIGGGHGNLLSSFIQSRKIPHNNNIYVKNNTTHNIFYFGRNKDIKLTLLSPTKDGLKTLRNNWSEDDILKKCQGSSIQIGGYSQPEDRREVDDLYFKYKNKQIKFGRKDTYTNNSSIAFILSYKHKNFLFLGDSDINDINNSLKDLGYSEKKDEQLQVEFVKLSHHGSKKNINDEFLSLIKSDTFVTLTNGSHPNNSKYKHPDKESYALILNHTKRAKNINLFFNYSQPIDKKFPRDMNERIKYHFQADKKNILRF
jgi:beta-lactamase superfamily II metal-dependent hydrolase